jgi:hypothetical protein
MQTWTHHDDSTTTLCMGDVPGLAGDLGSVAEVQFRTDAENRNRPNRTDSSVQVRFSPATPVVSSVLGSHISRNLRTGSEPVRTGPNREKITGWWRVTSDSGWVTSTSPITHPVSQTPRPPMTATRRCRGRWSGTEGVGVQGAPAILFI